MTENEKVFIEAMTAIRGLLEGRFGWIGEEKEAFKIAEAMHNFNPQNSDMVEVCLQKLSNLFRECPKIIQILPKTHNQFVQLSKEFEEKPKLNLVQ